MAETVELWLAKDPETERIAARTRPWEGEEDILPGPHGQGWERRTTQVPQGDWDALMEARITGSEMDRLHRLWWEQAS